MSRALKRGLWLTGIAAIAAIYFFADPAVANWFPKCMFRSFTGYDCPGCGMQRMAHSLLHGDIDGAFSYNAFLLCISPVIAAIIVADLGKARWPRFYRAMTRPALIWTLLCATLLWWLFRNIYGW